jgi:PAS domain S-box-containing protein
MAMKSVGRIFRGGPRSSEAAEPPQGPAVRTTAQAAMLQPLIDAIDALVVVVSPDCSLWLWNRRCDETSGVPFAEAAGKPLWALMRLRSNVTVSAQGAFDRLLAGNERSVEFRSQWLRKDGRKARVSWSARLVNWGDDGCFVVATGSATTRGHRAARESEVMARDSTAREETEAALQASAARVRAVFDQSSLGMLLVDRDGHGIESNPAYRRLLGYDAEELGRLSVSDYTHPADVEPTKQLMADLFAERNDGYEFERRYIKKDGREIWVRVHVSPVRDGPGPPRFAVGTVEDVTERKTLEGQLRESSKMEAMGRLAGGVAHDFNNLLQVINGYADLLVDSLEGDERAADAIELHKAGLRAVELTAQLLAFGRRGKVSLEPVDLNGRIEAMVPMLRHLLGEDIEFAARLDQTLGAVMADPSQLDQVVVNLVVNGRDAMPAGGSLTLTTSGFTRRAPAGGEGEVAWARLEIADTGFGMEPDLLEHVFEPFSTTKGQGKGTGLGLATAYGMVQRMGGHVRVESTVGLGSRFIVELPLCDAVRQVLDRPRASS